MPYIYTLWAVTETTENIKPSFLPFQFEKFTQKKKKKQLSSVQYKDTPF